MKKHKKVTYFSDSDGEMDNEIILTSSANRQKSDIISISSTEDEKDDIEGFNQINARLTPRSIRIINNLRFYKDFFSNERETRPKKQKRKLHF